MFKLLVDLSIQQFRLLLRHRLLWLVTLLLAFPFTMLLAFSQLHSSLLEAPYLGIDKVRSITAINLKNKDQQQPLPWYLANEFKQAFDLLISYERHLPGIMSYQQQRVKVELSAFSGGFKQFGLASYLGNLSLLDFPPPGASPAIALSYDFWKHYFKSDPDIIGKTVRVNERDYLIVAVMNSDFKSFRQNVKTDAIIPFGSHHLNQGNVFPDTLSYLLQSELPSSRVEIIRQQLFDNFLISENHQIQQSNAIGISIEKFSSFKLRLKTLTALISLLMVFCSIAYLGFMLQRQQQFQGEYKLRRMFGAQHWQINLQRLLDIGINSIFLLIVGLFLVPIQSYIAGLLFPGISAANYVSFSIVLQWFLSAFILVSLISVVGYWLQDKFLFVSLGRGQTVGGLQKLVTVGLISSQLALAAISLLVTILLTLHQINLYRADLGFNPANMHIVTYDFPLEQPSQQYQSDLEQLFRHLQRTNHETQFSAAIVTPLSTTYSFGNWTLPDGRQVGQISGGGTLNNRVAANYFSVMQTPFLLGRNFTKGARGEIVVNSTLWQRLFSQQLLTDARLNLNDNSYRIVGVVQDIRYQGPDTPAEPMVYLELSNLFDFTQIIAVAPQESADWLNNLIDFSQQLNPNLVANAPEYMNDRVKAEHAPRLSVLYLMFIMSFVSLMAAALFSYSALQQLITQQARELALRYSMGARHYQLIWYQLLPIVSCVTIMFVALLYIALPLTEPYLSSANPSYYIFALIAYLAIGILLISILSYLIVQRVSNSWLELTS